MHTRTASRMYDMGAAISAGGSRTGLPAAAHLANEGGPPALSVPPGHLTQAPALPAKPGAQLQSPQPLGT